jgi:NO-binding membrane sensor protein with MHYT domain
MLLSSIVDIRLFTKLIPLPFPELLLVFFTLSGNSTNADRKVLSRLLKSARLSVMHFTGDIAITFAARLPETSMRASSPMKYS